MKPLHLHLLVLDHHDSFVHNVLQLLRETEGITFDCLQTEEARALRLRDYDGVILSPGPGIPTDYPYTLALIAQAVTERIPLLGICLGHQAIATHFDAQLYQLPSPLHGHPSGLTDIDKDDAVVGSQLEGAIVGRYHSWAVEEASLPACLLATSYSEEPQEGRVVMSLRHRQLPIWGVQFHPESMITEAGASFLRGFLSQLHP